MQTNDKGITETHYIYIEKAIKLVTLQKYWLNILVDFLHAGCIFTIIFSLSFKRWHVIASSISRCTLIIINTQSKFDHSVNSIGMRCRIFQCKARSQQRGLKKQ